MVAAGNVGAPGRSNYGIVGDTVNATQRIEQLAKTVCTDDATMAVLVSERTRELAGGAFAFAPAGEHLLRGRRQPLMIYRLTGTTSERSPELVRTAADRPTAA
jgi:class 3 adenylate cyclase